MVTTRWSKWFATKSSSPQRDRVKKHQARLRLELLEDRMVPSTLFIDSSGNASWTGAHLEVNNLNISVNGGSYTFNDPGSLIQVSGAGSGGTVGSGTSTVICPPGSIALIGVATNSSTSTLNVLSTAVPTVISGNFTAVNMGQNGSMQGITSSHVDFGGVSAINLDDSSDLNARAVTIYVEGNSSEVVTGLAPTFINLYPEPGCVVTVQTGQSGCDVVNVLGTITPTTLIGHGITTVDVSNAGVALLDANLTVLNHSQLGFTSLTVDDSLDAASHTVTLASDGQGNGIITGLSQGTISYAYTDTPFFTLKTSIRNVVDVQATGAQTVTCLEGNALESVNVGNAGSVQDIQGSLEILNPTDATTLTVDDSQDAGSHTVTLATDSNVGAYGDIFGLAPAVIIYKYSDTASLTLKTGIGTGQTGSEAVNLLQTGVPTTIISNSDSIINVGNAGSVQGITGDLSILDPDFFNYITVDDSADTAARTVTLGTDGMGNGTIVGLSPATISYPYTDVASVTLLTGPNTHGPNTFDLATSTTINVQATGLGTATILVAGGATNVNVGDSSHTLADIQGALTVEGPGPTVVTVDDSGDTTSHNLSVVDGVVSGYVAANITAGAGVTSFTILNGNQGNSYTIQGTAADDPTVIDGGGGRNTFRLADAATLQAPVTLNGSGSDTLIGPANGGTWNITGTNSGSVGTVVFAGISNLVGAGPDIFALSPAGQVLTINGSGAGDWLDYSAFPSSSPVTVNLATGSATNVAGGAAGAIANIQNVRGGAGANSLTGDAQGNVLVGGAGNDTITGGSGRSVLVGGDGADQLAGNSDSDILVAGTLSSALNEATLPLVLQEWQRTDADYGQRLSHLEYGGGLNGSTVLTWGTTVVGDSGGATLTGGPGQNWFFANLHTGIKDTIANLNSGEQVNNRDFGYAFSIGATTNTPFGANGNAINTDRSGNVYYGGYFSGTTNVDPGPGTDYLTTTDELSGVVAKYTAARTLAWADAFVGTGGTDYNEVDAVVPDAAGNVYVEGFFGGTVTVGGFTLTGAPPNGDSYVAKLDSAGAVQWVRQFSSPSQVVLDFNSSLALDASGNSYVTGYFQGTMTVGATTLTSAGGLDAFIAKLDPTGNVLFAKRFGGTGNDFGGSIVVTSTANIIVSGGFSGQVAFGATKLTSAGGYDGFVAKLNSAGQFIWAQRLGGTQDDAADALVVDASGNIYASGAFHGSASFGATTLQGAGGFDAFVTKLNSSGTFQWAVGFGGPGDDETIDLALDAAGNLYTAGWFQGTATFGGTSLTSAGGYDSFVAKLNSAGALLWVDQMGGTGDDVADAVAVDGAGNVFSTGQYGYSSGGTSGLSADFDAGPAAYNLTTQDSGGSAYISKLTQPGPATFIGLTGAASASYDLTLNGGDLQLVDTTSGQVLQSTVLADTTSITVKAAAGVNTTLIIDDSNGAYSLPVTFVGSTGNNTLVGPNVNSAWTITGTNAGKVGNVSFSGVGNLVGGTAMDVFAMKPAGKETTINGGGGGDWLDYSSFTTAMTVNLATGAATNVSGGAAGAVTNIQNVHGGNGGCTLTGNALGNILIGGTGANTLIGGSGRSLLIGDRGTSNITGGSGGSANGGDLLIGGFTSYDAMTAANEAALMSILAEWQSADSLATRFADIDTGTGGGQNGTNKLNWGTTVYDNGKADILTAQAGIAAADWFFANTAVGHTTINNYETGEHKNNK